MDAGSDSDGLWRSHDFGATWEVVFYTEHLSCIGPDFGGYIPLGWNQQNYEGNYLELLHPDGTRAPLSHQDLSGAVRELEVFPLVNTPSFYVINTSGLFYLTGFLPVENEDETIPPAHTWNVRVYPNPAKTLINLAFEAKIPAKVEVTLFDLKGRKLQETDTLVPQMDILNMQLPDLPPGIYLLMISSENGSLLRKLVIIR
ncbi:MAG: T9SS type A sorting domain-containing protein [Candidatus Syntrophosphaera sp.]|nr:T9SS type A sorting domain-containing protein [Candidatus Syntrophosphaera sp.]